MIPFRSFSLEVSSLVIDWILYRFLIKFLAKLSEFSEVNKMSASNISLVIAPNLLWADGETG